jgi:hypothetical protein
MAHGANPENFIFSGMAPYTDNAIITIKFNSN